MHLRDIYQPILEELKSVEKVLQSSLKCVKSEAVLKVSQFLLESSGKRLRPAMVILSAKASVSRKPQAARHQLIKIASAMELIHMASLIHDDVIDHANLRHNKPTINSKFGQDVSIALGDFIYSQAFGLISSCANPDILSCISCATSFMCEGELTQVCERDNFDLQKERYFLIVKKKTASLFAASCQSGAMLVSQDGIIQNALKGYGLNFGIAFQIIDDYLDIVSEESKLGKNPGQDIAVGELTLPLLNLLETFGENEKSKWIRLLETRSKEDCLIKVKEKIFNSPALLRTQEAILSFLNIAKKKLNALPHSDYRDSLLNLADYTSQKVLKKIVSS